MIGAMLGPVAAAGAGGGAPAVGFVSSYSNAANQTAYTFTACDLGAVDTTREIFVVISAYQGGTARTLSSVTIGGVAATLETTFTNGTAQLLALARAAVPSGATGDVVATFSGAVQNCNVALYRTVNRVSAGAGATDTSSKTGTAATIGVTGVDVNAGGFVLTAVTWFSTVSAPSVSGLSAALDVFLVPEANGYSAHGSTPLQVSASTGATITWSWTTSRAVLAAAWAFPG